MRIIFMGSPEFSVPILKEITKQHEVVAVYAQPPKPAGRGYKLTPCPVHQAAEHMGLSCYTPKSLRNIEAQAEFASHGAELAVVVAYGLILPKEVLDAPKHGCMNIHASLLPRWRGAAPIQRAIEAGDTQTGITYMQMDEGLDTGDMLMKFSCDITKDTTGGSLHDQLSALGTLHINDILAAYEQGTIKRQKQPEDGITYAQKILKAESIIDWDCSATAIERKLRAFTPWPALFTQLGDMRIKILEAHVEEYPSILGEQTGLCVDDALLVKCGENALRITKLQQAGKKAMNADDFLRGYAVPKGTTFSKTA